MKDAVGAVRVEVEDSGAGFNEVDQARLFSEFCQFDRNKLQGGGLSLLIQFHFLGLLPFFYQVGPDWVYGFRRQSSPCIM